MILHITFKDIAAFFRTEKKVFVWLLICMVCGAFVLNYSYSFARYQGLFYDQMLGANSTRYKITAGGGAGSTESADEIVKRLGGGDFPGIKSFQLFGGSESGLRVVGSSFISDESGRWLSGMWTEGYYADIENTGEAVCAVNADILDYGGRFKMTGEKFTLDGEDFTIKGVYEMASTDVMIFADKFIEKYDAFDQLWIEFDERLNDSQTRELRSMVSELVPGSGVSLPPPPGEVGNEAARMYEVIYTVVIVMLVISLTSLLKYWQNVNKAAYTIYHIHGATDGTIMGVAFCETLVFCVTTFLAGLGLNVLARGFFPMSAELTGEDILLGFGIFFGTFAAFTLVNTARICKTFRIANIRRD